MKREQSSGNRGSATRAFGRGLVPCCALPLAAPRAPEAALPAMLPATVILLLVDGALAVRAAGPRGNAPGGHLRAASAAAAAWWSAEHAAGLICL